MADPQKRARAAPGPLARAWRSAGSLRVGIVLLAVLAAASVVGIVLPQPESFRADGFVRSRIDPKGPKALSKDALAALEAWAGVEQRRNRPLTRDQTLRLYYVDHYGKLLGWTLLAVDAHRLFKSWWFRLLCLLLIVNLAACSTRRLGGQWRAAFATRAGTEPGWYERRSTRAALSLPGEVDAAVVAVERALRAQGFRVHRRRATGWATLDGTRSWLGALGRVWWPLGKLAGLGRVGSQVVHLGVVLIVLGGFVSGLLSRSHDQVAAPGDVVVVPPAAWLLLTTREQLAEASWLRDPDRPSPAYAFRLRLDRFEARFNRAGKPEYYGADVTLIDTKPPLQRTIEVNRPLIYRGYYVYQQSYQPDYRRLSFVTFRVARVEREAAPEHGFHGPLPEATETEAVEVVARPGRPLAVPGMGLTLHILDYFPHWSAPLEEGPDGRRVMGTPRNASPEPRNPAVRVRVEAPGRQPFERWLFLLFPVGDRGRTIDYGPFRIAPTDAAPAHNTVLEFKTHPILWPVWLGCAVMMVGIVLCFYCNHERLWALVRPGESGCDVWLAGDAFKWRDEFRPRFDAVVAALAPGQE